MPDKFSKQFGEFYFVVVEGADCALRPVVGEFGKEVGQVWGHDRL